MALAIAAFRAGAAGPARRPGCLLGPHRGRPVSVPEAGTGPGSPASDGQAAPGHGPADRTGRPGVAVRRLPRLPHPRFATPRSVAAADRCPPRRPDVGPADRGRMHEVRK